MRLNTILGEQALQRGDNLFISDLNASFTYAEIHSLSDRAAATFESMGVQKGDRVLLQLFNSVEFIVAYFALLKIGAVVVPVSTSFKSRELNAIAFDAQPVLVIQHRSVSETTSISADEVPVIVIEEYNDNPDLGWIKGTEHECSFNEDSEPDDEAMVILYSSGTTGDPKGVMLTNTNLTTNLKAAAKCYEMSAEDTLILFLPLFHCFGLNAILNCVAYTGASIIIMRKFSLQELQSLLLHESITMFFAVPFVYNLLLQKWTGTDEFSNTKYFFSAASKLALETEDKWYEKYGYPIYQGYGLTETSPFASYMPKGNYRRGSIGVPIDHVEIAIDEKGYKDGLGEIIIKGPNVMKGYFRKDDLTDSVVKQGWFYSGDIGRMDGDGFLYIEDRKKDIVIVKGSNVFPSEVENLIMEIDGVEEVAVYGVLNSFKEEEVYARVVLKPDITLSVEYISTYCASHIADFKVPVKISFVPSLPKSPSGKVLKRIMQHEDSLLHNLKNIK